MGTFVVFCHVGESSNNRWGCSLPVLPVYYYCSAVSVRGSTVLAKDYGMYRFSMGVLAMHHVVIHGWTRFYAQADKNGAGG